MNCRKKLIEVALPRKSINEASAREKSIRHGHPSTLHLWWARRPLAACRAVLFSSLVDDPDSDPVYRKADGTVDEDRAGIKRAELLDSLATRAAKKLKNEESLLIQMGGVRLRAELDRIPLWAGNHVSIKQLAEYMARYLYLPRLRDEQVLLAAIQEGVASLMWQAETFAYAEAWDEQRQRYQGLRAAQATRVIVDDRSLLVKPDVAAAQLNAERQAGPIPTNGPGPEPAHGPSSVSTAHLTGSGSSTTTTISSEYSAA